MTSQEKSKKTLQLLNTREDDFPIFKLKYMNPLIYEKIFSVNTYLLLTFRFQH